MRHSGQHVKSQMCIRRITGNTRKVQNKCKFDIIHYGLCMKNKHSSFKPESQSRPTTEKPKIHSINAYNLCLQEGKNQHLLTKSELFYH